MASSTSLLDHSSFSLVPSAWRKHFFGAEVAGLAQKAAAEQGGVLMLLHQQQNWLYHKHMLSGLGIAHLALGFLVMYLVTSLGGPTGPGLNPCSWLWSSFGPRLPSKVYLGESTKWFKMVVCLGTSCSPPIPAAILAILLFKAIYLR